MTYTPQAWEDSPSTATPINASRLGHMETGIEDADTRITAHEADTAGVHGITDTAALATDTDVAAAVTAHEGAADPHPGYLTTAEGAAAYQPVDADLTAFAALAPAADDIVQRKAGAWVARTPAQVGADLALADLGDVDTTAAVVGQVPAVTQVSPLLFALAALTKASVGLPAVDNTADTAKPVSVATQAALDAQADLITEFGQSRPVLAVYTAGAYPARPNADLVLWMGPVAPGGTFGPNDVWLPVAAPAFVAPPASFLAAGAAAWSAANRAVFARFTLTETTTLRYLHWGCAAQSGNIQVGVVRLTTKGASPDFTRVMTSGVIACPTAGDIRTDLGATTLLPGDYAAFLWADNTTFQGRHSSSSGAQALRICAHSTHVGGVGTSGATSWTGSYVALTLEGE